MLKVLETCELVAKEAEIKIDLNCAKELANKVSIGLIEYYIILRLTIFKNCRFIKI